MIADFKLPIPATIVLSCIMAGATYLAGEHATAGVVESRVAALETKDAAMAVVLQSMTSRNEFLIFRQDNDRQLDDILARLKDIDQKVTR